MKKLLFVLLLVTMLLCSYVGFSLAQDKPLIVFSQCTMNHPWRVSQANGLKFWAEKMGVNFIWNDGQDDAATQLANIEDLLVKNPDVLIMSPVQAEALMPAKELCDKKGIPLICVDRSLSIEPPDGMYKSFVGLENEDLAEELAKVVVGLLYNKFGEYRGRIVELQGTIGAGPTIGRHNGFDKVIEQYPNITIIASQSADYTRDKGVNVMENYLQKFSKGEIDLVYAHNDEMGLGALQAIKLAGREELIGMICSIDGQRDALKAILDGEYLADGQYPPTHGEVAIKSAIKLINGEEIPPKQPIAFEIFHAQTAEAKSKLENFYSKLVSEDLLY